MFFGKFVKEKRISKKISLKKFTQDLELSDMSWWVKVENGRMPTPDRPELFKKISSYLNLSLEEENILLNLSVEAGK